MTRPRTNGPRSLIVTTTERPLFLLVTRTFVPNGSKQKVKLEFHLYSRSWMEAIEEIASSGCYSWGRRAVCWRNASTIRRQTLFVCCYFDLTDPPVHECASNSRGRDLFHGINNLLCERRKRQSSLRRN